jgi:hypothetical protein
MARCFYVVRCDFTRADLLGAWNSWYEGHIELLLAVPGFLGAQRFVTRDPADGRPYLALYELSGPAVLRSDAYQRARGFGAWEPHVRSWTRDLVQADGGGDLGFATAPDSRLWAAFFRGPAPATAARWIGLDHSFEAALWRSLGPGGRPPRLPDADVRQAAVGLFEPLTAFAAPAGGGAAGAGPAVDTWSSHR